MSSYTDLEEVKHGKLNAKVDTEKDDENEEDNIPGIIFSGKHTNNNNSNTLDPKKSTFTAVPPITILWSRGTKERSTIPRACHMENSM